MHLVAVSIFFLGCSSGQQSPGVHKVSPRITPDSLMSRVVRAVDSGRAGHVADVGRLLHPWSRHSPSTLRKLLVRRGRGLPGIDGGAGGITIGNAEPSLGQQLLALAPGAPASRRERRRMAKSLRFAMTSFRLAGRRYRQVWARQGRGPWRLLHLPFDLDDATLWELRRTAQEPGQPVRTTVWEGSDYLGEL